MNTYYPDKVAISEKLKPITKVVAMVVHHTASGANTTLENLYEWHVVARKFTAIGYHIVIFKDGTRYQTRPLDKMGAHCEIESGIGDRGADGKTKSWNHYSIGVCLVGNFNNEDPTSAQIEALKQTYSELTAQFGNIDITYHRKASGGRTECPGTRLIQLLENPETFRGLQSHSEPGEKTLKQATVFELLDELKQRYADTRQ